MIWPATSDTGLEAELRACQAARLHSCKGTAVTAVCPKEESL